jgi:hypothetical protein
MLEAGSWKLEAGSWKLEAFLAAPLSAALPGSPAAAAKVGPFQRDVAADSR